ncbi:hypothetical protein [Butyrivibrio sp. AE3004]|uniref:hypothetical protein n=1 Tax=Butyrivibrio sp. AE3004 TaxID=1506994 RepID=UPI000493F684|nr:hypothetical protein [Butyrivibrio sp. AE3004]
MKKKKMKSFLSGALIFGMLMNLTACGSTLSGQAGNPESKDTAFENNNETQEKAENNAKIAEENAIDIALKENQSEHDMDTQKVDECKLYEDTNGWFFELVPSGANESNWRTYVTFSGDGSFSGSFIKDFYTTSDNGEDKSSLDANFTGRLGECRQIDNYTWKANIAELTYDVSEDIPEEYSKAGGFEGYENGNSEMTFYLPGKAVEALPRDVAADLFGNDFGVYVGTEMDWVFDTPEDIPFYCMTTSDGCFMGRNENAINSLYVKNLAKFPGIVNLELQYNSDGTYYCVDGDADGSMKFINTCFKYDEMNLDVKECIKHIYDDFDDENLTVYGDGGENDKDDWIYKPDYKWLNGMQSKYASWSVENAGNYVFYHARFVCPYINDSRYVFAYITEYHKAIDAVDAETIGFALGSLSFSGRKEDVSCAGETEGEPYEEMLIYCKSGSDRTIKGDEVEFVREEDTEKIEKYGLDPNEFDNDYQIGGYDGEFEEFKLASDCPVYVQYAPDGLHRYISYEELCEHLSRFEPEGLLMNIILDKDGNVVLIKEPYTP